MAHDLGARRLSLSRVLLIPVLEMTPETDVPGIWPYGVSWRWMIPGSIKDQPTDYGTIMTMKRSEADIDAQQLIIAPSGEVWARGENSYTRAWRDFIKLG